PPGLQLENPQAGPWRLRWRSALLAPVSLRPTYRCRPFGLPPVYPLGPQPRPPGWLQKPRGRGDWCVPAAVAPRVRTRLAREEQAGPRSQVLSANPQRRGVLPARGPAGPPPLGLTEVPSGRRDGSLLREKG
ncbi:Hypothetical predicted protein, partial [Marmota monax]